ncbi:hypothetical protein SAMN05421858_4325 [Haladaptatus litoreus]|uniref:Uncharacterized protein n=1 Tax=Haladaptatus litoreus TaxID=553468 RepID=A0A1N7EK38_9EURY|nr:hypothetical protein [Haladaptatus litoreus]SIR88450.1 hypothetical protein SAMN05421858_4325 [Haladaptatus litoreus]
MDENFINDGLNANRYLKATELVHRFESEITEVINGTCQEIIDDHPKLVDDDASLQEKVFAAGKSRTLATIRTEFQMNVENENGNRPMVNIAVEWVKPEQQDEEAAYEGSLCYAMYKIQHGSESRFETVRERTEAQDGWDELRFGDDLWHHYAKHAPGIVYLPVETGPEIKEALQTLKRHFSEEYVPTLLDMSAPLDRK